MNKMRLPRLLRGAISATAVLLFGAAMSLRSQDMLDPGNPKALPLMKRIDSLMDRDQPDTLACGVKKIDPWLNFAFRWNAGYRLEFPLRQFSADAARLRVMFRVKPVSGERGYYFWQDFHIPAGQRAKRQYGILNGGYFLGEGDYQVSWIMLDSRGRRCAKQWNVDLKLNPRQRRTAGFLAPGTAAPIILSWNGVPDGEARPYQIAVVLHVSPIYPGSLRITRVDQSLLLTMLTSLFEKSAFREGSVEAINLNQQKVIFATDELDPLSFAGLRQSMRDLDLGAISFEKYARRDGAARLLARLANRITSAAEPPDAVVFIGPNAHAAGGFPKGLLESSSARKPLFFYLRLDYYSRRFRAPDPIERLTKQEHGKVFLIRSPENLARALEKMEQALAVAARDRPRAVATPRAGSE